MGLNVRVPTQRQRLTSPRQIAAPPDRLSTRWLRVKQSRATIFLELVHRADLNLAHAFTCQPDQTTDRFKRQGLALQAKAHRYDGPFLDLQLIQPTLRDHPFFLEEHHVFARGLGVEHFVDPTVPRFAYFAGPALELSGRAARATRDFWAGLSSSTEAVSSNFGMRPFSLHSFFSARRHMSSNRHVWCGKRTIWPVSIKAGADLLLDPVPGVAAERNTETRIELLGCPD